MINITIAVIAAAVAIWAMVDISRKQMNNHVSIAWFAVVILIPILGPLIYYFTLNRRT